LTIPYDPACGTDQRVAIHSQALNQRRFFNAGFGPLLRDFDPFETIETLESGASLF
jgi:hypothetical protein